MKAMAITSFGKPLEMITIEDPIPNSGEVVLSVLACGVCHTDLGIIAGTSPSSKQVNLPLVPGHETLGIVEDVGPGVEGWKVGDKALVYVYVGCGSCLACQSGYDAGCSNRRYTLGFNANGGYAEKIKVLARNLFRVSSVIPDENMATVTCAMGTATHAVIDRAKVQPGDRVLVVGAGGVGNLVAQLALWSGGYTIVADIDEAKLALAREVGVHETCNVSGSSELPASVRVNKIIEVSGAIGEWDWLFNALDNDGTIVAVGHSPDLSLTIGIRKLMSGQFEIKGSRAYSRANLLTAINLAESGKIKPLVGSAYPLSEANEVLLKLTTNKLGGTRAVLIPG
ncbi:alcohol dehydrogenase catalytic domain-containing protein [Chloroflexota bacterium]